MLKTRTIICQWGHKNKLNSKGRTPLADICSCFKHKQDLTCSVIVFLDLRMVRYLCWKTRL